MKFTILTVIAMIFLALPVSAFFGSPDTYIFETNISPYPNVNQDNSNLLFYYNISQNTNFIVQNDDAEGNPATSIKNNYDGEKSLNNLVYGKNTSFSDIGNYKKNESVRSWAVNSHYIIDTFNNDGGSYDTVLSSNGNPSVIIKSDTSVTVRSLRGNYSGGYAHVCVDNTGSLWASEVACP